MQIRQLKLRFITNLLRWSFGELIQHKLEGAVGWGRRQSWFVDEEADWQTPSEAGRRESQ